MEYKIAQVANIGVLALSVRANGTVLHSVYRERIADQVQFDATRFGPLRFVVVPWC